MDELTSKQIFEVLNPENESEEWPEFETIKDDVVDFMSDLPIEVYERLFRAVHNDKGGLTKYLLDFPKTRKKYWWLPRLKTKL